MKAAVLAGPRDLRVVEVPVPQPESGSAVLRVLAAGICGSDLHGYAGASGRRAAGTVMGHEIAATVVEVGDAADRRWIDRNVTVDPLLACGQCPECERGAFNLCRHRRYLGIQLPGAFAEMMTAPVDHLVEAPAGIAAERVSLAEPLAVALHAVARVSPLDGADVCIVGAGAIGLLAIVAARRAGAGRVTVVDPVPSRRSVALRLGADEARQPMSEGATVDGSFDVVFDAVGSQRTFTPAVALAGRGGRVVAIGGWNQVQLDLPAVVAREIHVLGTFNFCHAEFVEAVGLLATLTDIGEIPIARAPLSDAPAVFAALVDAPSETVRTVLIPNGV